jgi:hypothetical protein
MVLLSAGVSASGAGFDGPPGHRCGGIQLDGHALRDDGGPFLGLGASYFTALRRVRDDRARFRSDLRYLSRSGFRYIRAFSMVGWYPAWSGNEIAPVTFQNKRGETIRGWDDYDQQLRDMIDIAYDGFGIRTQLTIFADAQLMPRRKDRVAHLARVLAILHGREQKVILLEVANEAWQNGFAGEEGIADLRAFGKYLNEQTDVLVALSATQGQDNAALTRLYHGAAADIATEHFSRDLHTADGGWLPVFDPYRVNAIDGLPPVSSNEPIGPGSSVAAQNDPIKLVSAAAYAWMSGLPMYVYHTSAGVFGKDRFEDMPGADDFRHLIEILPGDIPNWRRAQGNAAFAPFILPPNDPKKHRGAVRHLSCVKQQAFYTLSIGIDSAGVPLRARRGMAIEILDPLTGQISRAMKLRAGEDFVLPPGPGAQLIRGRFEDGSGRATVHQ